MKKRILATALLLAGCTSSPKAPVPPVAGKPPAGVIKIMGGKDVTSYVDFSQISTYQGNSHMRRFYMINNYAQPALMIKAQSLYISSSRASYVIDCELQQHAVIQRFMFSEPYAQGTLMTHGTSAGQWQAYPANSLIGIMAEQLCKIPAARLKPEPPEETRTPLLDAP